MTGFPQRVRVVVLGSGLHGLGLVDDLLSRGWQDVVLLDQGVDQNTTAQKADSYELESLFSLFNFRDFRHIPKAMEELPHLSVLAGEGIYNLPFRLGLDASARFDAGFYRAVVRSFRWLTRKAAINLEPAALQQAMKWPASVGFPDVLVSSGHLHRNLLSRLQDSRYKYLPGIKDLSMTAVGDGWNLRFSHHGKPRKLSSLYVVNALGPEGNRFLADHRLPITWPSINLERRVEYYTDLSEIPLFHSWILPRQEARPSIQMIPLGNRAVLMTIEEKLWGAKTEKDLNEPSEALLEVFRTAGIIQPQHHLQLIRQEKSVFSVLYESQRQVGSLRNTSPFVTSEHRSGRGLLLTLYNMKTMTYRAFAEEIGDRIISHFGEIRRSRTRLQSKS